MRRSYSRLVGASDAFVGRSQEQGAGTTMML